MAEGIYGIKCPKCGEIYPNEYVMTCDKCKEKLYPRVKAKYHKQEEIQQEGIIEMAIPQDIASRPQILTPERPKEIVRIISQTP